MPVAAGGLSYEGAAKVLEGEIGIDDLKIWNIRKIKSDPANESEIRDLASRILSRRVREIDHGLAIGEPLNIVINTRADHQTVGSVALKVDWRHRFDGRVASSESWSEHLLPSLVEISDQIGSHASNRSVLASGLLSLPTATALGWAFLDLRRIGISWLQSTTGFPDQIWSLADQRKDSGFETDVRAGITAADDLAVLVSVNADVSKAVVETRSKLPEFRALVHVKPAEQSQDSWNVVLRTPGEVVDVARRVIEGARQAKREYNVRGKVHMFMAVPSGLAMLIGQLLNTLGQVHTYEHIPDGATGHYVPAALLGNQPKLGF